MSCWEMADTINGCKWQWLKIRVSFHVISRYFKIATLVIRVTIVAPFWGPILSHTIIKDLQRSSGCKKLMPGSCGLHESPVPL